MIIAVNPDFSRQLVFCDRSRRFFSRSEGCPSRCRETSLASSRRFSGTSRQFLFQRIEIAAQKEGGAPCFDKPNAGAMALNGSGAKKTGSSRTEGEGARCNSPVRLREQFLLSRHNKPHRPILRPAGQPAAGFSFCRSALRAKDAFIKTADVIERHRPGIGFTRDRVLQQNKTTVGCVFSPADIQLRRQNAGTLSNCARSVRNRRDPRRRGFHGPSSSFSVKLEEEFVGKKHR